MKKFIYRNIVLAIILLALNFKSIYASTTSGMYKYDNLSDGTISIVGYTGNIQNVVVPSTIDGKKVSMIGMLAFENVSSVKTIVLPEGIVKIDAYAFDSCKNLTNVTMPSTLKSVSNIFHNACPKINYTMPSTLTKLSDGSYAEIATVTTVGTYNYDSANKVLDSVNAIRSSLGLKPLTISLELTNSAMQRAAEIAIYWDHERPNSLSCFSVSKLINGENIGVGSSSVDVIMNKWMNSPGHKAQIVKSTYNSIGIGCYQINGLTYWVQLFSKTTSTDATKTTGKTTNVENKIDVKTYDGRLTLNITGLDKEMNMAIGETKSPKKATITNKGYSSAKTQISLSDIKWSSSDEKVFTVDKEGKITIVGGGKATLTATLGESELTYNIVVNNPLQSISLPKTAIVYTDSTTNLTVKYIPENTTDSKSATWSTSNAKVATVDNNGKVKGISEGTATITVKVGTKTATCVVTVKKTVEEKIYFSKQEETILVTENTKVLDFVYEPGTNTNDETITWSSSDTNIVDVNDKGELIIKNTGKVTIEVQTANGNKASCEVEVIDYLKGDLDKNGIVNANDAAIALDLYKYGNVSAEELKIGDMDNNGIINANDAALILDIYKYGN